MCTYFKRKVYSVGDGLCYEGIIKNELRNEYHFVIDCGSQLPQKKQRIGELSKKGDCQARLKEIAVDIFNKHGHINLFILTHLHRDHYNGMKFLFKEEKPDTIIMPYLYPTERLCLIINSDTDEEDNEFLASPYRLVREMNPEAELILIRGNSSIEEGKNQRPGESISWGIGHEDTDNILAVEDLESSNVKVVRADLKGTVILKSIWMFKFFNLEADKDDVDMLKKIAGNLTAENLCNKIRNREELKKLKRQYRIISKKFLKDLNNTSIITFHAPTINLGRCGTLITGDIDLNHGFWKDILKFFKTEMKNIGLFSIPHHGSNANWNKGFIDNGDLDDVVCFASTHNYYPQRLDAIMMSDLRVHNISVLAVDEKRVSEFKHKIIVKNGCHFIKKRGSKMYICIK